MKQSEQLGQGVVEQGEQQLRAIAHLLEGKTKVETARILDISPRILDEWFKQAEFIVRLNAARHDAFHASMERLRALAPNALKVLEKALVSKNEATRLRVAELILKTVKLSDISAPKGPLTVEEFERNQSFQQAVNDVLDAYNA